MSITVSTELIERKVYLIRGQKVMIDRDLAALYGVSTSRLNEQVKRNARRFPSDFMFQIKDEELKNWMSQIAITNREKMGIRRRPYAFTEQGIAMLSGVLHSERAVEVNIAIMRTFVKFRQVLAAHKEIVERLGELERQMNKKDKEVLALFEAIRKLMAPPPPARKGKIGF